MTAYLLRRARVGGFVFLKSLPAQDGGRCTWTTRPSEAMRFNQRKKAQRVAGQVGKATVKTEHECRQEGKVMASISPMSWMAAQT